jgi:hypothetical protein
MLLFTLLAVLATAFIVHRHRAASLLLVIVAFTAMFASPAHAASDTLTAVQLSSLTVSLIIGVAIPLITGLVTKYTTSSGVKGLITLVLNAVQTLVVTATIADGTAIVSRETFIAFCLSLTISIATYAGVYAPLNLTSSAGENGRPGLLASIGRHDR